MGYLKVYSPLTGTLHNKSYYCEGGGSHIIVNNLTGWHPIDIMCGANTSVYFISYGNTGLKSIRTRHISGMCAHSSLWGNAANDGLVIEMYTGYSATGTMIGTVGYGHLTNRIGHNNIYNFYSSTKNVWLGQVPLDTTNCNGCDCYRGEHIHMQASGLVGQTGYAPCSGTTFVKGSHWVYEFWW